LLKDGNGYWERWQAFMGVEFLIEVTFLLSFGHCFFFHCRFLGYL